MEISFISDPTDGVTFPHRGETTELPDLGFAIQGKALGNQTAGEASKVDQHLTEPFFCYTWLMIINTLLARKKRETRYQDAS